MSAVLPVIVDIKKLLFSLREYTSSESQAILWLTLAFEMTEQKRHALTKYSIMLSQTMI